MRTTIAALLVLLTPAAAWAQSAAPASAPTALLPFGPLSVLSGPLPLPQPGPNALFAARPDTYVPHVPPRLPVIPFYSGLSPWGIEENAAPVARHRARATAPSPDAAQREDAAAREPRPDLPSPTEIAPVTAPEMHAPDTFYVIPGCYAGNRPPTAADVPRGCDRSRVRVVPIR